MPHGSVKDGALAVANDHHHGFVALAFLTPCRGEDLHVFGWTAQGIIEFVLGMFPLGRHPLGDRVGFAQFDDEFVLRSMAAAAAWACVTDFLAVFVEVDIRAVFFGAIAPTSKSDDLVVFGPIWKRVIGGMDADELPAIADVRFKGSANGKGPILPVVITHDDVVFGELWIPRLPSIRQLGLQIRGGLFGLGSLFWIEISGNLGSRWGGSGDLDGELPISLEVLFHDRCHGLPVVVVLAIEDQDSDGGGLDADLKEQEQAAKKGFQQGIHGAIVVGGP